MSLCLLGIDDSIRLFGLTICEFETDEADRLNLLPDGNIREGCSLFLAANHQHDSDKRVTKINIFSKA